MVSKTVTTTDTAEGAEQTDTRSDTSRRGDKLAESIYQAVEDIIKTEVYTNLTFQKIAQATQTSRTVLYRRWETPLDLVHDIVVEKSLRALGGEFIDMIEDTGSLRSDLLHMV